MATTSKASRFLGRASRTSWPDKIINLIIPAAFFILPTFFFNFSWQGASLDRLFVLSLIVIIGWAAWLAKVLLTGSLIWHWRKVDWLALVVMLVAGLATFWSPTWRNSLLGGYGQPMRSLVFFLLLLLFYYLVVNNWSAKLRQFSWLSILVSFSFITIYSLSQLFGLFIIPLGFTKTIGFNPIGSLSNLALFLGAALPLFILSIDRGDEFSRRALSSRGRLLWNIWLGFSAFAAVVAMIVLGSFTLWLMVILGLLIILAFALSRLIKLSPTQLLLTVGALALSFVLLIIGNFGWLRLNLPSEVSLSRGFSWQIAKASLVNRPILGSGLASFNSVFSRYKTTDFNSASLWNLDFDLPAGYLAESLVIIGGLGTILLVAFLLWSLILVWRRLLSVKADLSTADLNLGVGLLAAVSVLLVGGLLLPIGNNLLLIFGLLWVLLIITTFDWPRRQPVINWRQTGQNVGAIWTTGFIIVAIGLLSGLAYGSKVYLADVLAGQSIKQQSTDQQLTKMAAAHSLASWREMYGFGLAQLSWLKANEIIGEATQATGTPALEAQNSARAYVQQAKQLLDNNYKSIKHQPASLKTAAALYEMIDELDGALMVHQQLLIIDVNNPWSYAKIAQIKVAQAYQATDDETKDKLVAEALNDYQKAIELKSDWAEAYFYRAALYQAVQKSLEATQDLVQAVNYSNGAADYVLPLAQLLNERAKNEVELATDLHSQAQQLLQGVLSVNSNNINALYILAMVYRDSNQLDLARQTVDELLGKVQESDKPIIEQQFGDLLSQ